MKIITSTVFAVGMLYVKLPVLKSDFKAPIDRINFAFSIFSLISGAVMFPI